MTDVPPTAGLDAADIAIVGMAAHLPGAADIATYWANLRDGRTAVRRLTEEELQAAGESAAMLRNPAYVPYAALLDGFDRFDADFFGFSPKEAAILDPQHRQFLEVTWEALEAAGHPPERFKGRVGVFAGCGMGSYFYFNLCSNPALVDSTGMFLLRHTGNDKDFLSTRVSHVFDLKGPSLSVQTACSTSLVAVHYAVQALLTGECDMALAGGVTIDLPQGRGYVYKEGEVLSPDGMCHAFDHRAQGTVFGSGAGAVVLRRLEDALADGDHIWAVIKGSAVNNDGAAKAGYLAPSVEGQADCIATALGVAGVSADTVDYIECHGTGTYLGDPIEVTALTEAFRRTTSAKGFARIGSVKTNIGHLDTAAGAASLIKTSLALYHRQMPPSLNYEAPNPVIDFDNSPFRVNDRLTDWPRRAGRRRAGVNSLGVGGTNAHVVLEEPPELTASEASDWPFQVLTLSARSAMALGEASSRLAAHLRAHPEQDLADIAFTLKEGRRAFEHRRVLVAASHEEAAAMLEAGDPRRVFTQRRVGDAPDVVFMFPGGGAQYPNMARDLYETEPVFAEWMDRGLAALGPLEAEIRALWLPAAGQEASAAERLRRPSLQLPLILIVEIALARLWESWGVTPSVLIGHSMGENAAACLAGVMSLEDAVGLVHLRGQLFDTVPAGGMLSVPMSEVALAPFLGDLDIASVNAPELTVVSGSDAGLADLADRLRAEGVETSRIAIDIAAHSRMLEPILDRFRAHLAGMRLSPPRIPIISNRSGQVLTDAEATSPDYWVAHLRGTVRFADGIATLRQKAERVYLEVGPGRAMATLAQANGAMGGQPVPASLRHPDDTVSDDRHFLATLGRLWACGAAPDWSQIWGEARRRRVPLPTYPFQRSRYFIEPGKPAVEAETDTFPARRDAVADFGYRMGWRTAPADCPVDVEAELGAPLVWLVFADEAGVSRAAVQRLRAAGHKVITVHAGDSFARTSDQTYTIAPEHGREGYDALLADLAQRDLSPARIAHFWLVTAREMFRPGSSFFQRNLEQGFWSLFFLGQAMGEIGLKPLPHLVVFTSGAAQVRDEPVAHPEKATVAGPVKVMPREFPGLTAALLDVQVPSGRAGLPDEVVTQVLEEMLATPANTVAALRGARRYEARLAAAPMPEMADVPQGSVWVVTGGFGGIGVTVAERLMRDHGAKIALIGRKVPEAGSLRAGVLARLERLGKVVAIAADVCNPEDMRAAVSRATDELGPIYGVVHAAGTVDDAPLLGKASGAAEAVLSPKVHGTQLLGTLFPDGSIARMVLFSSTSTVTSPAGQTDYVAANEFLNAFAKSRSGGKTKVTAINWGIWSGIGMAADADARRRGEDGAAAPLPGLMILERMRKTDEETQFFATLTAGQWVMDDHRLREGTAVLPGAAWPEIAAEALTALGAKPGFVLNDLTVFRPLRLEADMPRDLRVTVSRSRDGQQRLQARALESAGWVLTAEAGIAALATSAGTVDLDAIAARCPERQSAQGGLALPSAQEERLAFGPRWQVLRATQIGAGEGLATLALPTQAARDTDACALHPALFDIGTGWGLALLPPAPSGAIWAPVTLGQVRVYAPLPAEIRSWARLAGQPGADVASFDVTLTDPAGRVLVEVEGITFRSVAAEVALARPAPPSPREVLAEEAPRSASPAEQRLAQALAGGIRPAEGAEAFLRALAVDAPQVLVSSLDLQALVRQSAAVEARPEADSAGFARPELETAYVAPRTAVERTLAGFWSELLGVAEVGVEDDFFTLGGHSLIAVRLFAMIRRQWKIDFPISVLFEAPTIARCAELIAARLGPEDEAAAAPAAKADPAGPKFTHLVAMHSGEGGPKTPFFLVAGMFGNVLNLRHLAHLLGNDRPFYGLQARGLFGDAAPHTTIEEAAADCLAEIRRVQPSGPYLLGGFSGGGLTAWEIGRQLRAMGEEVALMVLLDTPLPVRPELTSRDKAMMKLAELRRGGPRFLADWARRRIEWERSRRAIAAQEPDTSVPSFHNAAIEAAFRHAVGVYQLLPWQDGRVVLYRPPLDRHWKVTGGNWVSAAREYVFADNLWTPFAPALEVVEVPGDHDSMVLEPNVRVLAARMRSAIQAAEAAQTPDPDRMIDRKVAAE
ncbi:SDR family NAD(P)-dependent oxidoreductase [Tabrizicola piscis]|uniref:SDR family NAD(P)-dependent oxidoreductase n=1 Tax=Tabrizicola piscis TaxID=2494374 RepID=A0A3S8UAB6_9RHOB|nr:type I polyketide synthase [Tabrizicola piscis]AZL60489.1 SDR family NAD(P)-dependent oxidoreductase [Tabrizicola piscis]